MVLNIHMLLAALPGALAATFYVAPTGSDTAAGSLAAPYRSIQVAVDKAAAGDIIYLRGGKYSPTKNIQIKKSGTASAAITLSAYQSEVPIIDGEGLPNTPAPVGGSIAAADRGVFHVEKANYWKFIGLEVLNGPYGFYVDSSSNNLFERIVTHDNYETGFQLQGASSNNKIYYLDSYANRDPRKNGESADGFACKEGDGEGNILKGARLWNNVDDGLDLWEFRSKVTIVDTISWGNGFNRWNFANFQGDGNGFKLGGGDEADKKASNHDISNCIAFQNAAKGFTDNKQTGNFVMKRNTAWNNAQVGFQLQTSVTTLTGNLAGGNLKSTKNADQVSLSSSQKLSGNSWSSSKTWPNSAFKSVDISLVQGKRAADGKIAASNFLLPADGSAVGATTSWS
ncbi:pectate lyase L [Dendryphion nanum]|uniref:Pectate lyase L n=1 Tax=Dendryphion nanum TaxID=256645 RepID=A0A9P9ECK4_9PLEO|nr:pectate lyase L [Dendryphion nanum]